MTNTITARLLCRFVDHFLPPPPPPATTSRCPATSPVAGYVAFTCRRMADVAYPYRLVPWTVQHAFVRPLLVALNDSTHRGPPPTHVAYLMGRRRSCSCLFCHLPHIPRAKHRKITASGAISALATSWVKPRLVAFNSGAQCATSRTAHAVASIAILLSLMYAWRLPGTGVGHWFNDTATVLITDYYGIRPSVILPLWRLYWRAVDMPPFGTYAPRLATFSWLPLTAAPDYLYHTYAARCLS